MNLFHSTKSYEDLIQHMEDCGYSEIYISRVKREIRWLSEHMDAYGISTYSDACRIREKQTCSRDMHEQRRAVYSLFQRFSLYGELPSPRREPLFMQSTRINLNAYFQELLDHYESVSKERGLKYGTIRSSVSACSGLLLALQESGYETLEEVPEESVLSYFLSKKLSSSTKINIASVFASQLGPYTAPARRILTYLPALHRRRINIHYLLEDETTAIRSVLQDSDSAISLRNRAIVTILFFTGMRASDVASLRFSDIDWNAEELRLFQRKTGNELLLPLTTTIGNAIFDYIRNERPESKNENIFLCEAAPHNPVSPRTIGNAALKIFEAAFIRQGGCDHKGTHLFRHNLATSFVGQGIPRPIISATLGHADPASLDHYLFADIKHLRTCALSIDSYPVGKEVFQA